MNGLVIEHCNSYVYLGSPFTCDGNVSRAVKLHANNKMPHVLKFVSFIKKNNDVPFVVKRRVFDAALMSSLLYGCESWLNADLKPIIKLYNWCLKQLLGVRKSTPNDVCYIEAGYPSLLDLVEFKQHKFFKNMWVERRELSDDPLIHVMNIVVEGNCMTARKLRYFINNDVIDLNVTRQVMIDCITTSESSRRVTYKDMNPDFIVHYVYSQKHTINEHHRLAFTRFLVSSHSLACGTGRWNRRGRVCVSVVR